MAGRLGVGVAPEKRRVNALSTASITTLSASACLVGLLATGCGGGQGNAFGLGNGNGGTPTGGPAPETLSVSDGDVVGRLEILVPDVEVFPLHGTLPVPPGTFPRADGKSPFVLQSPDGTTFPAQVEVVSRYANAAEDGADVVEILSRVSRPEGAVPGTSVRFKVISQPTAPSELAVPSVIHAFTQTPKSALLRARDVFGNVYEADLLEGLRDNAGGQHVTSLKSGPVCRQVRTYHELLPVEPVEGAQGTLPHLMGVHAYVTQWAGEEFLSLDLRVHNGHAGSQESTSLDDPLGKLYFDKLQLRLPSGWSLGHTFVSPGVQGVQQDGAYALHTIVPGMPDNTMNVMGSQAQFHRRMVIIKEGAESNARSLIDQDGLAFCRPGNSPDGVPLWSWWNEQTARYFPQKCKLPTFEHLGEAFLENRDKTILEDRLTELETGAASGFPAISPRLGWAHPLGVKFGGMHGGEEIWLYDGLYTAWAASVDGYRLSQLTHRRYTDRQPTALYESDGSPTKHDLWVRTGSAGPYQPAWMYMKPILGSADPFGMTTTPSFQRDYVEATNLQPDYEEDLLGHGQIDLEHLIRYTRSPKVLAYLGNDSLAKDDLWMQAELFYFGYNVLPQSSNGQSVIGTGLLHDRNYVEAHPGWGVKFGRSEGWGLDVMTAWYNVAPIEWREEHRWWFDEVIDMLETGQSACTGTFTTSSMPHMFGGQYRNRQSIEACIAENAIWEVARSVYDGADENRTEQVDRMLRDAIYGMISEPIWSPVYKGPHALIAMGPYDANLPPFCGMPPADGLPTGADVFQLWPNFVYGYRLTGDPIFLQKADELAQTRWNAPDAFTAIVGQGMENLANRALFLGLLQDTMSNEQ